MEIVKNRETSSVPTTSGASWSLASPLWYTLLLVACIAIFIIPGVSAVKQEDFKLCSQSGFCTRQRAYADLIRSYPNGEKAAFQEDTRLLKYAIKRESLRWDQQGGRVLGELWHASSRLGFTLSFMEEAMVRLQVDQVQPQRPRYRVANVLIDEGQTWKKTSYQMKQLPGYTSGAYAIEFGSAAVAVLFLDPFGLDIYRDGILLASINRRNFFHFEHDLQRPPDVDSTGNQTTVDPVVSKLTQGMWSDTFKSFTDSIPHGPQSVGIDVDFIGSDDIFGLPEHASNLSLKTTRGGDGAYTEPYRLYNLDVFEFDLDNPMALYGSVPLILSQKWDEQKQAPFTVGFFWLNAAETWVDVEKVQVPGGHSPLSFQQVDPIRASNSLQPSTSTHWISESGVMDFFILTGPRPKDVMKQYAQLTGSQNLPQLFALGYHQCRWNYIDTNDVLQVHQQFELHDIPVDVIWLDIEHTDEKKYFTWHSSKFVNPEGMQKELAAYGRKMVTIIDPHIKRDDTYFLKQLASEKKLFVQSQNGNEFDGWCWPGSSSWIDYTNPEARRFWAQLFAYAMYKGSTETLFTWNDMNEPSVFTGPEITMPKTNLHYQGWEHRDLHNIYGMLLHRSTYSGHLYRSLPEGSSGWFSSGSISIEKWAGRKAVDKGPTPHRPFILSRAFFAGTQRYGAIWTGDNMARWSHLKSTAPMLLSISLGGVGFCGADVGGFFFDPDAELLTRWFQAGIWYPFFRAHAHIDTKRREPWLFGEPYTSIIRAAIVTRYQFLPYWYTLFRRGQIEGAIPIRPLFYEFPEERTVYKIEDQYMVGPAIMVKPIVSALAEGGDRLEVYLPGSEYWYNYYNRLAYAPTSQSGRLQPLSTPLSTPVPVFLRAGSIVPTRQRVRRSSTLMHQDPFTFHIALSPSWKARGELYLDDGESFMYTRGEFVHKEIKIERSSPEQGQGLRLSYEDVADASQTMQSWQKPFLGDLEVKEDRPMTLISQEKYKQQVSRTVRVERITILGISPAYGGPTSAPHSKSSIQMKVRMNGGQWNLVSPAESTSWVEEVTASEVYGTEKAGQQQVLGTWNLIVKNPPVRCGDNWELAIQW